MYRHKYSAVHINGKMCLVLFWPLQVVTASRDNQWCIKQCRKRQGCLCAYMRDNERETGREEDRDGGGLSNTLLIKVKEMFYSWSRQRQQQQRQQGQGWNELAFPFPRANTAHSLRPGQRTHPLPLINNVKTHTHTPPVSLINNCKSHTHHSFLMCLPCTCAAK